MNSPGCDGEAGKVTLIGVLVALSFLSLIAAIAIPLGLQQKSNVEDKIVQNDLANLQKIIKTLSSSTPENALPAAIAAEGWKASDGNGIGYIFNCSLTDARTGAVENDPKNYILWGYRKAQGSWNLVDFRAKEYIYDSKTEKWHTFGEVQDLSRCTVGPIQTYDMNTSYKDQ